jgi:Domain of unknown function (DUF4157)
LGKRIEAKLTSFKQNNRRIAKGDQTRQPPLASTRAPEQTVQRQTRPAALVQRTPLGGRGLASGEVLQLQRTIGNRAVGALLEGDGPGAAGRSQVQIGPAGDSYEQEADRTAEAVTTGRGAWGPPLAIRRQVQRQALTNSLPVSGDFESRLQRNQGDGFAVPETVRQDFEPKFSANFGSVRLHTGSGSADLNRQIDAKAFTHGQDIYFNQGQYNPHSTKGRNLLAHELTHTLQQKAGAPVQRKSSDEPEPTGQGDETPVKEKQSVLDEKKTLHPGEGVIAAISKDNLNTGGHAWVATEYLSSSGENKTAVMHLTAAGGKGDSASGGSGGSGGSVGSDHKSAKEFGSLQSGVVSNEEDSGSLVYSAPSNTNVGSAEPATFKGKVTININDSAGDGYLESLRKKSLRTWSITEAQGQRAMAQALKMEEKAKKGKYIYSLTGRSISFTKTGMNCARFAEQVVRAAGVNANAGWIVKTPSELSTGLKAGFRWFKFGRNKNKKKGK